MNIKKDTVFFYYHSTCYDINQKFIFIEAVKEKSNGELEFFERLENADFDCVEHGGLTHQDFKDFEGFLKDCKLVTYDLDETRELFDMMGIRLNNDIEDLMKPLMSKFKYKNKHQLLVVTEKLGIILSFGGMSPSEMLRNIYKRYEL